MATYSSCFNLYLIHILLTIQSINVANASETYLYRGVQNGASSYPVIEYLKAADAENGEMKAEKKDETGSVGTPPFLLPQDVPRIVEFYAPWCPHCQHFKPRYIELAKEVTSLLLSVEQHVEFHAVSCTAHKQLCKDNDINGYPTIVAIPTGLGKDGSIELKKNQLHNGAAARYVATELGIDVPDALTDENISKPTITSQEHKSLTVDTPIEQIYHDASLSFRFALEQGIYMANGPLDIELKNAFKDWIQLLHLSLPPQINVMHNVIDDLIYNYKDVSKSEENLVSFVRTDYQKAANAGGVPMGWSSGATEKEQLEFEWSTYCTHQDAHTHTVGVGYTCGLWQLFHIMTVGVAELARFETNEVMPTTAHAADTLRNYVEHFFGCDVCRLHFLQMYDACSFDRCARLVSDIDETFEQRKQLALWLWETHNDVNVRLRKEKAEREGVNVITNEMEVGARWPSKEQCSVCWHDDGSWDENMVYLFLKHHYWRDNGDDPVDTNKFHQGTAELVLNNEDSTNTIGGGSRMWTICLLLFAVYAIPKFIRKKKKVRSGRHKKLDSRRRK